MLIIARTLILRLAGCLMLTLTLALALTLSCAAPPAWSAPAPAADQVVGMVLDLRGAGTVSLQGDSRKLQLLNYIKAGATLQLDAGASLSVSHYGAKLIYQLTGPAQAMVEADRIRLVGNAGTSGGTNAGTISSKSLGEKLVTAALNPSLGAAAFRMRGFVQKFMLTAPLNRSRQMTTRPHFKWDDDEGNTYRIVIEDEAATQVLASGQSDVTSWELPPGVALEFGKSYRWTVSYRGGAEASARNANANASTSTSAIFSVVTQAEADELQALRPAAGAGIDEWVLYAVVLQDRKMLDDARDAWSLIGARRPDLKPATGLAP